MFILTIRVAFYEIKLGWADTLTTPMDVGLSTNCWGMAFAIATSTEPIHEVIYGIIISMVLVVAYPPPLRLLLQKI